MQHRLEVLANAPARSGMDPARRRTRNRRSGQSEARRRRWAWENLVIGELWARWWAAQWRWEAELERVAGREAAAQWAAGREVALARWQREEEKRRRFQEADEERKKAEEERWLTAVCVCGDGGYGGGEQEGR